MIVIFILLCVLLYYILGRLYVEVFMWPMIGNPKDYNDLYRGLKIAFGAMGNNTFESEWWIEQEKEYGFEWAKIWVIVTENIWAFGLIAYVIIDMKNVAVALLKALL